MDQKFLAGIGNIYSDEILFGAGLRWDRMSDSLSGEEVRRLYRAMVETLQDAVKYRGSSLADEQYVDLFGQPGRVPAAPQGVRREGEACRRCRQPIVRQRPAGGPRSSARRARFDPRRGPGRRRDTVAGPTHPHARRLLRSSPTPAAGTRRRPGHDGGTSVPPCVSRKCRGCGSGIVPRPGAGRRGRRLGAQPRRRAGRGRARGPSGRRRRGRRVVPRGPRRAPTPSRWSTSAAVGEQGFPCAGRRGFHRSVPAERDPRGYDPTAPIRSAEFCEGEPAGCSSSR